MSAPILPGFNQLTGTQQVHPVAPPPQSNQLVRDVAGILATQAAVSSMSTGLLLLLKPYGITLPAIQAALVASNAGTVARPNARLAANGIEAASEAADSVRKQATSELYYRAAYVIAASQRLTTAAKAGEFETAVSRETSIFAQHEAARRGRIDAAASAAKSAQDWGQLLGWWRDPSSRSEAECIAADGNNFYADQGTTIGFPGSVHPGCNCFSGPPHPAGGMVDDAVRAVTKRITTAKILKIRRVA